MPRGFPVGVEVDTLLGITRCAMAEVCGVELGVAPLRPPNFHTVERQVKFVPYGEQVCSLLPGQGASPLTPCQISEDQAQPCQPDRSCKTGSKLCH